MTDQPDNTPQPHHGAVLEGSVPLTDHVKAGPGGAMTDEVGATTGDLTLRTEAGPDGTVAVRIQGTGAEERYALTGSPAPRRGPW
ncbi:hypothetical protein ACODT5_03775 [Streptomyces sp. 5.8]|uniref:hypothetical protein n=1 Tax=Streptomyces sp. 5.8 TaxID=3406571 RepID=UPI003BB4DECA